MAIKHTNFAKRIEGDIKNRISCEQDEIQMEIYNCAQQIKRIIARYNEIEETIGYLALALVVFDSTDDCISAEGSKRGPAGGA